MRGIKLTAWLLVGFLLGFAFICQAEAKPFRVAVILPGTIQDHSWGQAMYEALCRIRDKEGAENFEFVYSESLWMVADAAAAIRDYANQGYDMVICHGSEYGSSLVDIARDFPKVSFAWGSTAHTFSDQGITNVFAYEPHSEEGGYLNGMLAAKLSRNKVVAVVGTIKTGDARRYAAGFQAGAKAVDPKINVIITWVNSYSDIALASETAQAQMNAGADVLTGTSQLVQGAIGPVKQRGGLWCSYDLNQKYLAPETVVSACVVLYDGVIMEIVKLIKQGQYGGIIFPMTLKNGGLKMEVNSEAIFGKAAQAIEDGTIKINIDI